MSKLSVLGILAVLFATAVGITVELSLDHGETWEPYSKPLSEPPLSALLRVRGGSPMITIPACALKGSLLIQVWKDAVSQKPLGMRWKSKMCHPNTSVNVDGVVVQAIEPKARRPDWYPFLRDANEQEQVQSQTPEPQPSSWWRRYSLYIMLFFVVALGQGIRQGLAEQRLEIEREEEERKQKNRSGSGQVRVLVPRRKETRARRRSAKTAQSS